MGFKRSWVQIPPARGYKSNNVFHVYVLRSMKTGRHYVGSCQDLDDRIRRDNAGHSKATRHGTPWFLVKKESFSTRTEAVRRERYFKTGRGCDELAVLNLQSGRRGDRSWVQIPP